MGHQATETPPAGRSRTLLFVAVGAAVLIAVTTSGITMAGVFSGAPDAPAAAAPQWLTPPGPGDPILPDPMPGGAPAVPAEMADASVPVMPPAPVVPVVASSPDPGSGAVVASTPEIATDPPAVAPPPTGGSGMVGQPMMTMPPAAVGGLPGLPGGPRNPVDTLVPPLPGLTPPASPTATAPTTTTTAPTTTTPTSELPVSTPPLPVCVPSGKPIRTQLRYDEQGRIVAVIVRNLQPECGPVTIVIDLGPDSPDITITTPTTGGSDITVPLVNPLAIAPDRIADPKAVARRAVAVPGGLVAQPAATRAPQPAPSSGPVSPSLIPTPAP